MEKNENHYSILQCDPTASFEEIKRNYQRLIREHHPDKGAKSTDQFLKIDKAYKILQNDQSRKDYDSSIFADNCQKYSLIYAKLLKKDIDLDTEGKAYYPCRCGATFVIEQEYIAEPECLIECNECSNCISVT